MGIYLFRLPVQGVDGIEDGASSVFGLEAPSLASAKILLQQLHRATYIGELDVVDPSHPGGGRVH